MQKTEDIHRIFLGFLYGKDEHLTLFWKERLFYAFNQTDTLVLSVLQSVRNAMDFALL